MRGRAFNTEGKQRSPMSAQWFRRSTAQQNLGISQSGLVSSTPLDVPVTCGADREQFRTVASIGRASNEFRCKCDVRFGSKADICSAIGCPLNPKADICSATRYVRFVPKVDMRARRSNVRFTLESVHLSPRLIPVAMGSGKEMIAANSPPLPAASVRPSAFCVPPA